MSVKFTLFKQRIKCFLPIQALITSVAFAVDFTPEFKTEPLWDIMRDAGPYSEQILKTGSVPLTGGTIFEIPHTAIPDSSSFTMYAKVRFVKPGKNPVHACDFLRQRTADTGWGYRLAYHEVRGLNTMQTLEINDGVFECGWTRAGATNTVPITNSFVVAVRDGLIVAYADGQIQRRYFSVITPNLEPIKVGGPCSTWKLPELTNQVEILDLKFFGPEEKYHLPNEPLTFAEGYRGGNGWLMNGPSKETEDRPRLLYYGDSISVGYSTHLRKRVGKKAWLYHWKGCVTDANITNFNHKAFKEAASVSKFDMIVFNNGLHSLHWTTNKVSDAQIENVTRAMVTGFRAGAPQAKLVWLATTPRVNHKDRTQLADIDYVVRRINRIAAKVMKEENVEIIDAYELLRPHWDKNTDGYHWQGSAYDLIAAEIEKKMNIKEKNH